MSDTQTPPDLEHLFGAIMVYRDQTLLGAGHPDPFAAWMYGYVQGLAQAGQITSDEQTAWWERIEEHARPAARVVDVPTRT